MQKMLIDASAFFESAASILDLVRDVLDEAVPWKPSGKGRFDPEFPKPALRPILSEHEHGWKPVSPAVAGFG